MCAVFQEPLYHSIEMFASTEGASEFTFQAQSMVASVAATLGLYFSLQGMGYGDGDTLVQVWTCLIFLQLMRGITASWKIAQKDGPIDILTSGSTVR